MQQNQPPPLESFIESFEKEANPLLVMFLKDQGALLPFIENMWLAGNHEYLYSYFTYQLVHFDIVGYSFVGDKSRWGVKSLNPFNAFQWDETAEGYKFWKETYISFNKWYASYWGCL